MSDDKFGSWCSGIGGADEGVYGLAIPMFGYEIDSNLVIIGQANHSHIKQRDVTLIPSSDYKFVNIFHISPPCQSFSRANNPNTTKGEKIEDINIAEHAAHYIAMVNPDFVTVENVGEYAASKSFKIITEQLFSQYTNVMVEVLNFKHYGLPQNRRRLIIRASNRKLTELQKKPPVGWYKALEGSLDSLVEMIPTKKDYQILQNYGDTDTVLYATRNCKAKNAVRQAWEVAPTIIATQWKGDFRIYKEGNVYKLQPKHYGILQSFPAHYRYLTKIHSVTGIGNAVPPMIYRQILENYYGS